MRLANRIDLDPHYVAGLEELPPGIGAAVGSREAGHSSPDHLPDRLFLKLARNNRSRIRDGNHASTIQTGHRQLGGIGLR